MKFQWSKHGFSPHFQVSPTSGSNYEMIGNLPKIMGQNSPPCDHFSEKKNFKKIENFKKKIFQSCYFIFEHGEKKKFFFEIFFGPDFDPNSENVAKEWKSQISNYRLETFFERHFYTQNNVLSTPSGISDDIAAK